MSRIRLQHRRRDLRNLLVYRIFEQLALVRGVSDPLGRPPRNHVAKKERAIDDPRGPTSSTARNVLFNYLGSRVFLVKEFQVQSND